MKFAHFSHIWAKPGMTPHQRYEELWRELKRATSSASIIRSASSIIFVPTKAGCRRRASMRSAPARGPSGCASGRWAISCRSTIRCALPRRSPSSIRCSAAAWSLGSCPASMPIISAPSGSITASANRRRWNSSIISHAAFGEMQPFSFHGQEFHTDNARISVQPAQLPHPPLWMMSRDPQTLEFCARHAINPGYFLVYPRADAAPRYRKFLADWKATGRRKNRTSPIARSSMSTRPTTRRSRQRCSAPAALTRDF